MKGRQRAAALLEVLGVYLAGQLVTGQLIRLLGLRPANPLANLTVDVTDGELIAATWQLFVLLVCNMRAGSCSLSRSIPGIVAEGWRRTA